MCRAVDYSMAQKLLIFLVCLLSFTPTLRSRSYYGSHFRNDDTENKVKVEVHPQNATVKEGDSFTLECKFSQFVFGCSWQKDSQDLLITHLDNVYVQTNQWSPYTVKDDCSIKIKEFERKHIGCYQCFGESYHGTIVATSHRACLTPFNTKDSTQGKGHISSATVSLIVTVIGMLCALVVLIALLTYYCGRKRGITRTKKKLSAFSLYLQRESNRVDGEIDSCEMDNMINYIAVNSEKN